LPLETKLFEYDLPEELIAQNPLEKRDGSRLLVIDRRTGGMQHKLFSDLPGYVRKGDLFIVNDSRVLRARVILKKETGGRVELLFLRSRGGKKWSALARPGKRLAEGTPLYHESLPAPLCRVVRKLDSGICEVEVAPDDLPAFLELHGDVPLPPYIKKKISDPERYQTVYSGETGSAAAPTAGLHFTNELMEKIRAAGGSFSRVTLHVGIDTFRPIATEYVEDHEIHSEYFAVPDETAAAVAAAAENGGRVIAVGTTSVRALESWSALNKGKSRRAGSEGETRLFIYDKSQFTATDAMITNFHLPRSTLLAMVSAFCGAELLREAYNEAVRRKYRFFSFGDAMLIV